MLWTPRASAYIERHSCFFFFQAEDGIRDKLVTGVQTCALPICRWDRGPFPKFWSCQVNTKSIPSLCALREGAPIPTTATAGSAVQPPRVTCKATGRSEERRVGKECRSRGSPYH